MRIWNSNNFPSGFNADEAAIGYNAYSLLETGRDEHGNFWPIHFKSFGDWKPGLFFYFVLPFVKLLGLTEFAVRLPSAILGVAAVFMIYLLTREFFKLELLALLTAFLLTISPWHLHFSRGGWEVNAATTLILAGIWMFIKSLKKPKFLPLAVFFLSLSLYTYHSARIIVPLLVLGLLIIYRKFFLENKKIIVVNCLFGFLLLTPLVISFFSGAGVSRFSGVGFTAQTGPEWRANELRGQHRNWNNLPVRLLHNKFVTYSLNFLQNYSDHFDGNFLFVNGDIIERNRVPEAGLMYFFEIPFVLLGIYFFFTKRPENWPVVFLWLAVAPIAAAMTFQTPHALRAHNMVIPLTIISAYGLWNIWQWVKFQKSLRILLYGYLVILVPWSIARYLHEYYIHYPKTYPVAWEYGFKELVEYIKPLAKDYNKIYVTETYDQPYILFLFYLKYPPDRFQREVVLTPRDKFGFSTVRDFDKFHFEGVNWESLSQEHKILVCGTKKEIPEGVKIIKDINFPNGETVFTCVEN